MNSNKITKVQWQSVLDLLHPNVAAHIQEYVQSIHFWVPDTPSSKPNGLSITFKRDGQARAVYHALRTAIFIVTGIPGLSLFGSFRGSLGDGDRKIDTFMGDSPFKGMTIADAKIALKASDFFQLDVNHDCYASCLLEDKKYKVLSSGYCYTESDIASDWVERTMKKNEFGNNFNWVRTDTGYVKEPIS